MLYILTRPLTREPFGLEVWMRHIPSSYLVRNILLEFEERLIFEPVSSSRWLLIPMSRNQFNQKLKLIVEAPRYIIYYNNFVIRTVY